MKTNQMARQQAEAELGIGILQQALDQTRTPNDLVARMADMAVVHLVAAARIAAGHQLCPGCSGLGLMSDDPDVLRCQGCGGVYTANPITPEQAIKFVAIHLPMVSGGEPRFGVIETFYFDLELSDGRLAGRRIHGWADKRSKRVTQWG